MVGICLQPELALRTATDETASGTLGEEFRQRMERASVTEGRPMFKGCGEVDDRDAVCSDVDDAVGTHRTRACKQLCRRCVRCLQRQSNA